MSGGEFERIVKLDRLPEKLTIEADEGERKALAKRFGLPSIQSLRATVSFAQDGDTIDAKGRLEAAFEQLCAIADEPFANTITEPLAIRFVPALPTSAEDEEQEFSPDEPDEVEYDGAAFDLGEAVAESFGLALDPYATGPDADAARKVAGIMDENTPSGPFAALAALMPKD
jgi:uncharacterized metal-binding protein YceD (DUF177 family)